MRFPFACAVALLVSGLAAVEGQETPGGALKDSPVEQFKRFFSSPPVIEDLVFSERLPPDPKAPWRTDLPLESSTAFRYYHARWQSNAFLLREIESPEAADDLKAVGLVASHYEDECWFRLGPESHDGLIDFGANPTNEVCKLAYNNAFLLNQVLNLGVMHAEVGSLTWEDDKFNGPKVAGQIQVSGDLSVGSSGLVDSISVKYTNDKGDIFWKIRYAYEGDPVAGFIPSQISCFWLNGETEVKRADFALRELKLADAPLPRDAFDCSNLAKSNDFQVNIFTNGAVFATGPDGQLTLVAILDTKTPSVRGIPSRIELGITYSLWGAMNATFLILMVRVRFQTKINRRDHETSA